MKNFSVVELQNSYINNHGFIFQIPTPINTNKIEAMAQSLITGGITKDLPEFTVLLNPQTLVFVWHIDSQFNSPEFYHKANGIGGAMGIWNVDTLRHFLQTVQVAKVA